MTVAGERRLAMTLESETSELELIATAFRAISKEIGYVVSYERTGVTRTGARRMLSRLRRVIAPSPEQALVDP